MNIDIGQSDAMGRERDGLRGQVVEPDQVGRLPRVLCRRRGVAPHLDHGDIVLRVDPGDEGLPVGRVPYWVSTVLSRAMCFSFTPGPLPNR